MTVAAQLNPADEEEEGEDGNHSDIIQGSKKAKDQKD